MVSPMISVAPEYVLPDISSGHTSIYMIFLRAIGGIHENLL